jgi:hypothetical protein
LDQSSVFPGTERIFQGQTGRNSHSSGGLLVAKLGSKGGKVTGLEGISTNNDVGFALNTHKVRFLGLLQLQLGIMTCGRIWNP